MTHERGEKRWSAKLTEADVRVIRERAKTEKLKTIAADYPQVSKVSVHYVIAGKRWKYLKANHDAD